MSARQGPTLRRACEAQPESARLPPRRLTLHLKTTALTGPPRRARSDSEDGGIAAGGNLQQAGVRRRLRSAPLDRTLGRPPPPSPLRARGHPDLSRSDGMTREQLQRAPLIGLLDRLASGNAMTRSGVMSLGDARRQRTRLFEAYSHSNTADLSYWWRNRLMISRAMTSGTSANRCTTSTSLFCSGLP
jgi:hypothetical protein